MTERKRSKVQVKVRLPVDVKAQLDAQAKAAGVSLSTIIQLALDQALGRWKAPA
jgi:post-segregation antitoxin (ccd killing protein)